MYQKLSKCQLIGEFLINERSFCFSNYLIFFSIRDRLGEDKQPNENQYWISPPFLGAKGAASFGKLPFFGKEIVVL